MKNRIEQIVRYRTGGKRKQFAELMGWTPQYLTKLLQGKGIGIAPIIRLIEAFPELDARWLLTGAGAMFNPRPQFDVLLDMQRYLPVMTDEELSKFAETISSLEKGLFPPDFRLLLENRLVDRFTAIKAAHHAKNSE